MLAAGEAVVAGLELAAELGHHPVPGIEQAQSAAGPGAGQEGLADADAVQDAGDLVVEVDGAGQRVGLRVALEHGDRDAPVGEQQRGGAADRAGADDDDRIRRVGAVGVGVVSDRPVRCGGR